MTITVSMPWYGAPELLGRAVRSVLAQGYPDLRLVVVADGAPPPDLGITDPRLHIHVLSRNRGAYFAHQLVLMSTPDAWFAPVDADDFIDPSHFQRLMAGGASVVVPGALWFHDVRRGGAEAPVKEGRRIGWHVGLFSTERLRSIGGYEPEARLSQDTLVLRLLDLTGTCRRLRDVPTYHRWKRAGSLTTAPATGLKSPARAKARAHNRLVLARCRELRTADAIRRFRAARTPLAVRRALDAEVARLAPMLRAEVAA